MTADARHILTMVQTLRGGGVERALLRLMTGWIDAGRRVTLVAGSISGPLAAELPEPIELIELGSRHYPALLTLPGHIKRARPDIVFVPGNHYTSIAAWAKLRLSGDSPPMVGKISNALVRHDQYFPVAQAYPVWLRMHPWFLEHAVAMSPGMRDEAITATRLSPERISVIANPPTRPIQGAAQVPLPEGRFLLGVGRLARQKRWDRLIDALSGIDPSVRLVILGDGAERAALERHAAKRGVAHRVSFPGHAADPLPAIARAEAVVLTSDFEGVPGVLREALSVGTPVVATDSSVAVREIITAPDQGEVVPIGDAPALLEALKRRLAAGTRPAPRESRGTDSAAEYLALFDRIVAQRSR